jgi:UDP-glucose 4-epimerase
MKNKRILVTGGAGFIGTNLVKTLAKDNTVISLDVHHSIFGTPLIKDITDESWIDEVGTVDYVFHLAAVVGVDYVSEHPFETMNTEIQGMNNVVKHAMKYKPKKVIFTSSSVVYGNASDTKESDPVITDSTYGVAKQLAEIYLQELNKKEDVEYSIARLFNIYGPYQSGKMVAQKFIYQAKAKKDITVYGDGQQTRDLTYVDDAIEVLIKMAKSPSADGEVFNVGSGDELKMIDFAKMVKKECRSTSRIALKRPPRKIMKFEGIKKRGCNNSKIKKVLKFNKWTPLKKGLRMQVDSTK